MTTDAAPFTIVLTRPAGQSATLMETLATRGICVIDFPLLAIEPVPDTDAVPLRAALGALERYALVVFVSPNAVDRAFAGGATALPGLSAVSPASFALNWPRSLPVAVVGPSSVAALARHGLAAPDFTIISPDEAPEGEPARFDSESLYEAIEKTFGGQTLKGHRVLIVRGDGGREWLAGRLREAGAEVETVAAYRRVMPQPSDDTLARVRALLAGEPHAWLVTSSEGVRNLEALARLHWNADENAALRRATLVAPHPRIAETARSLGFGRITLSGAGDERIKATLIALAGVAQAAQSGHSTVYPAFLFPAVTPLRMIRI